MTGVTIRFLRGEDIEAVAALETAQLQEHDLPSDGEGIRAVLQGLVSSSRDGFILLAVQDAPIGFAYVAALASLEHGGRSGWLEELYVMPEWRGRGIGRDLLAAAIRHAREMQWRSLDLEVVAGHERVVPLYERAGFAKIDRSRYGLELAGC